MLSYLSLCLLPQYYFSAIKLDRNCELFTGTTRIQLWTVCGEKPGRNCEHACTDKLSRYCELFAVKKLVCELSQWQTKQKLWTVWHDKLGRNRKPDAVTNQKKTLSCLHRQAGQALWTILWTSQAVTVTYLQYKKMRRYELVHCGCRHFVVTTRQTLYTSCSGNTN